MNHAPDHRHTTRVHRHPWDRSRERSTGSFSLVSLAACVLMAAALAGCGGGGSDGRGTTEPDPAPTAGALAITIVTGGTELDADGYTVAVDGGTAQAIATGGSLVVPSLEPGTHAVVLDGVADNCTVPDGSTQTVSVTAGDTTAVTFAVTCTAVTGALTVITATDGTPIDPDGYEVILADSITTQDTFNGIVWGDSTVTEVDANGSTTVTRLQPGTYDVILGDVNDRCSVSGGAAQLRIPVVAGDTTSVNYTIHCSDTQPIVSSLEIQTNTTGFNIDTDGYSFLVDFGEEQSIGTNGSVTIQTPVGSPLVWLRGVAPNCVVTDTNMRTADIHEGVTTSVAFDITCGSDP
jgi:hypothetical protein